MGISVRSFVSKEEPAVLLLPVHTHSPPGKAGFIQLGLISLGCNWLYISEAESWGQNHAPHAAEISLCNSQLMSCLAIRWGGADPGNGAGPCSTDP